MAATCRRVDEQRQQLNAKYGNSFYLKVLLHMGLARYLSNIELLII